MYDNQNREQLPQVYTYQVVKKQRLTKTNSAQRNVERKTPQREAPTFPHEDRRAILPAPYTAAVPHIRPQRRATIRCQRTFVTSFLRSVQRASKMYVYVLAPSQLLGVKFQKLYLAVRQLTSSTKPRSPSERSFRHQRNTAHRVAVSVRARIQNT